MSQPPVVGSFRSIWSVRTGENCHRWNNCHILIVYTSADAGCLHTRSIVRVSPGFFDTVVRGSNYNGDGAPDFAIETGEPDSLDGGMSSSA